MEVLDPYAGLSEEQKRIPPIERLSLYNDGEHSSSNQWGLGGDGEKLRPAAVKDLNVVNSAMDQSMAYPESSWVVDFYRIKRPEFGPAWRVTFSKAGIGIISESIDPDQENALAMAYRSAKSQPIAQVNIAKK